MGGLYIVYLLLLVGLAFIPASIASGKGYSFGGFYAFGFFFFLPALIVSLVLDDKNAAADREYMLRTELRQLKGDFALQEYTPHLPPQQEIINPICPNCGRDNASDVKFCTKCGAKLSVVAKPPESVCPKCRTRLPEGDEFCGNCGWKLTQQEPETILVSEVNGMVTCPACTALQMSNRTSCYKCGAKFAYS